VTGATCATGGSAAVTASPAQAQVTRPQPWAETSVVDMNDAPVLWTNFLIKKARHRFISMGLVLLFFDNFL
jgi:hypothetical protein